MSCRCCGGKRGGGGGNSDVNQDDGIWSPSCVSLKIINLNIIEIQHVYFVICCLVRYRIKLLQTEKP